MPIDVTYDKRITGEFVLACAKCASVQVLSSQVILSGESLSLEGLEIPPIYQLQWIGVSEGRIQVNLKLKA